MVSRLISRRNSAWVSGRSLATSARATTIGWISASCCCQLRLGHLDRHAGVGPRRELVEHVLADPADHAVPQPVADRVEVADADDLVAAVGSRIACSDASRHLGSSAMSSTHSTIEASSSIRFSIGVPVSTRR